MQAIKKLGTSLESLVRTSKETKGATLQILYGAAKVMGGFIIEDTFLDKVPFLEGYLKTSGSIDFFAGAIRYNLYFLNYGFNLFKQGSEEGKPTIKMDKFKSVEGWIKENWQHLKYALKSGLEGYIESKYHKDV